MQAFTDIEGKIPAKDGDRVALAKDDYGNTWIQENLERRPVFKSGSLIFESGESMGIAHK